MTRIRLLTLAVAAMGGLVAAPAARPASAQTPRDRVRIPTQTYIGFNPLGLPANIFTVEIENAVASGITVGGVGSYIDVDHSRYTTGEFKVRYYPSDVVLRGFAVGATAGVTRFRNIVADTAQTLSAPTIGILLDYDWLLGRSERFLVGTGIGAKRILASKSERERADVDYATLTARLILGFAF